MEGPKTQEQVVIKPKGKKQHKKKAATAAEEIPKSKPAETTNPQDQPSSSEGLKSAKPKSIKKLITRDTSPSSILNAFQKQDMAPEEWQNLADQVVTRGLQKTAEKILNSRDILTEEQATGEHCSPPGFSDESMIDEQTGTSVKRSKRAIKNQVPKIIGSPVKHSVKEITTDEDIADLNDMALEQYRYKLANLKTHTSKPLETRLNLLERHLFRRNFGYSALDTSRPWKTQ